MSRYTIKRPAMMQGIDDTRFNPRVIISCLITLAIYMIYNVAASIIGIFYIGSEVLADPSVMEGSFDEIVNSLMQMIYSQPFIIILLFSMALLIGLVIIEARAIEKKKLRMIGLVKTRFALKYIIGAAVGLIVLFVLLLPTLITEYDTIYFTAAKPLLLTMLFAFMVQSAAEELLFRGYLMTAASRRVGMFWGVVISSVVFAMLHIVNSGITVLSIVQIFLLGSFFGFYVIRTNSIWGAFGMHFAWNFAQGLFANLDVSYVDLDYRVMVFEGVSFEPDTSNLFGSPAELIPIALLLAAIAVVLFVGKNKIVVKKPVSDELEY